MQLIVGLGNPGDKHKGNRHNAGFLFLDFWVSLVSDGTLTFDYQKKFNSDVLKHKDMIFAKPQTFMNSSGDTVRKIMNFYKINTPNLWVIHDDLDIKLGQYKIQKGVGPKLHNGIESIERSIGKSEFWRVRIGVDNREKKNRISGEDYVLQNFSNDEKNILQKNFPEMVDAVTDSFEK